MLKVHIIFLKEDKVLGFWSMVFSLNLWGQRCYDLQVTLLSCPPALVGVLQRNRPAVRVYVCVLTYYKQKSPCNYEGHKFQDLQTSVSNWGPRRAEGVILVQVQRQKKANIPVQTQSGRRSFSLLTGGSAFLFYSVLPLIRYGPPNGSTDSWVTLMRSHPPRHIGIMSEQAPSPQPVKPTQN